MSIIVLAAFTSCKKDNLNPNEPQITSTADLVIKDNFNWKTTRNIDLTVKANESGLVEVASKKGVTYLKFYLTANKSQTMKLTIPTYETSVVLKFMGKEVTLNLSGDKLNYQF